MAVLTQLVVVAPTGIVIRNPLVLTTGSAVVFEPGCFKEVIARCWAERRWARLVWEHEKKHRLGLVVNLMERAPGDPRLPEEVRALGRGVGALVGYVHFWPHYARSRLLLDYIASCAKLGFSPRVLCEDYEERGDIVHMRTILSIEEVSATWTPASPATGILRVA